MTLTEFLEARITEDEEAAREGQRASVMLPDPFLVVYNSEDETVSLAVDPARVLAECAAKRRIVEDAQRLAFNDPFRRGPYWDGQRDATNNAMQDLASVYADHPDYQQEWA